jgi:predicted RNA binding protein YcfA (HicA-like mRNA interferase family)
MNWTFQDVVDFLKQHNFRLTHNKGSHYYYLGNVDGKQRYVEVPYHGRSVLKPKTLKDGIAHQSGIPESYWLDWAKVGQKRLRKNIRYSGAV